MLAKIKQSPWIALAIRSSIGLITNYAETMLLPGIQYNTQDDEDLA